MVWAWNSDAFGNTAANEDPDNDTQFTTVNLRFPGQYVDLETNIYYNNFRYYDPATGRYITSDPIGLDGGLNKYSYALNNPIKFTDPSGLFVVALPAIPIVLEYVAVATTGLSIGYGICAITGICNNYSDTNETNDSEDTTQDTKQCQPDNNEEDDCKDRVSDWRLSAQGIDAHELKREYLGSRARIARFELCKCKDGTVAIRNRGCTGPIIRTWVRI